MNQLKWVIIGLLLINNFEIYAQEKSIDTLKVGFWANDIFDIDYKKGTYKISLFIWTNSYKEPYYLDKYLDFHQQASLQTERVYVDTIVDKTGRKVYWTEIRATIEIINKFDVSNFPFDKEKFILSIEFTYDDYKKLFLEIDTSSSLRDVKITNDWVIKKSAIKKAITNYNTSFGDPLTNSFNLQTINLTFDIERESFTLYFKMFLALFVSFLIACSSIFVSNETFEPRFSLIIGGLFGAISNKYVTESILPESNRFTLSDKLHLTTIIFLFILTIITIVENRLNLGNNSKFEKYSFFGVLLTYILLIIYISVF
jgi:hypothetical protein